MVEPQQFKMFQNIVTDQTLSTEEMVNELGNQFDGEIASAVARLA